MNLFLKPGVVLCLLLVQCCGKDLTVEEILTSGKILQACHTPSEREQSCNEKIGEDAFFKDSQCGGNPDHVRKECDKKNVAGRCVSKRDGSVVSVWYYYKPHFSEISVKKTCDINQAIYFPAQ